MGNNRNKNKKRRGRAWLKERGRHMVRMKAMQLQAKRSAPISTNDSGDNEQHASTSAAHAFSGELFADVPSTAQLEAGGPDAFKQQPPTDKGEVVEKPEPLPKLRRRRYLPPPTTISTRSTLRVSQKEREQLARLVRGHPVLYDAHYPHFRDKAQTHYAWQDIGKRMLRTESECISIWKLLKLRYKQAVQRRKVRMNQGFIIKPSKYEDFMSFVKPFLNKTEATAAKRVPRPKKFTCEVPGATAGAHSAQQQRNNFVELFRNLGETVKDFPLDVKNHVKYEVFKVISDAREFVLSNTSVEQLFVVQDIKSEPLES